MRCCATPTLLSSLDTKYTLEMKGPINIYDLLARYPKIPRAMTMAFSLLEFPFMSFDLNTAQTFQRFIDGTLCGLDFAYAYIDDVLIDS